MAGDSTSPELQVCAAVRALVGWDRVAVVAADGLDHRMPLPGSDAVLMHWGDLQQSLAQGPGADVLATGAVVLVNDLRSGATPWTVLQAASPADLPVRSLAVVPLLAPGDGQVVGLLSVARDAVAPFDDAQVTLLTALAALLAVVVTRRMATGSLLGDRYDGDGGHGGHGGHEPGDQVAVVLGMLVERLGTSAEEALARLRAYAFSAGCTIHQAAGAVVAGRVELGVVVGKP